MRNMIIRLPEPLYIEQLDDVWVQLLSPFPFMIKDGNEPDEIIIVSKGFKSDYASVPKIPGFYEIFGGKGKKASVGHDFGYSKFYTGGHDRKWWDAFFHHALLATGIDPDVARHMYEGVRVGGDSHWKTEE